jgi:hypothetical protein
MLAWGWPTAESNYMCMRSAAQNQPAIQRSVRVRLQVHKEQQAALETKAAFTGVVCVV